MYEQNIRFFIFFLASIFILRFRKLWNKPPCNFIKDVFLVLIQFESFDESFPEVFYFFRFNFSKDSEFRFLIGYLENWIYVRISSFSEFN